MKLVTAGSMIFAGLMAAGVVSSVQAQNSGSFSGIVEQVLEDGFRLNTDNEFSEQASHRALRVDSWDVCGDFTANHVAVGDRLTVTGEFAGREFDAFSITNSAGISLCQ